MTNPDTEVSPRDRILAFAAERGLTMTATFVPYSQSPNSKPRADDGKPWPSLNWTVRLERAGRLVLETTYAAGIGHAPAMKGAASSLGLKVSSRPERKAREELALLEIEKGRPHRFSHGWGARVIEGSKVLEPDLADVLYSLSSDSSVLDAGGFEAWAANFGYDPDSRKAEATYRGCLEIALKLRASLGDESLSALREAAEDY